MSNKFIEYPPCSTCKKAKKWLIENEITFEPQHIVENTPTEEQLALWIKESGLPMKSFFNTRGVVYRELNLKDKLDTLSEKEQIKLLANDGKLIKRPLFIGKGVVLVGFKEKEWDSKLK